MTVVVVGVDNCRRGDPLVAYESERECERERVG